MDKLTWEATVQEDPETGELVLPLPEDLLAKLGWQEGDELNWINNQDGSWTLEKVNES